MEYKIGHKINYNWTPTRGQRTVKFESIILLKYTKEIYTNNDKYLYLVLCEIMENENISPLIIMTEEFILRHKLSPDLIGKKGTWIYGREINFVINKCNICKFC